MGKQKSNGVLTRLAGKSVVLQGRFGRGESKENLLKEIIAAHGGRVVEDIGPSVDYVVLADATAGKTVQKKADSLNKKGANVQVIDVGSFEQMLQLSDAEVLASILRGPLLPTILIAPAPGRGRMGGRRREARWDRPYQFPIPTGAVHRAAAL